MNDYQEGWNAAIQKAAGVCDEHEIGYEGTAAAIKEEILALQPDEQVSDEPVAWMNNAGKTCSALWRRAHCTEDQYDEFYIPLFLHPAPPVSDEAVPVAKEERLTDKQCDGFRRLPCSFNDMVRAIYEAGMDNIAGLPDGSHPTPNASNAEMERDADD